MSTVFSVDGPTNERPIEPGTVEVLINGNSQGRVRTNGENLRTFVTRMAQQHGIRTFSVYTNGEKATTAQANDPVDGVLATVEIVAKDQRGADGAAGQDIIRTAEAGKEGPSGPSQPQLSKYEIPAFLQARMEKFAQTLNHEQQVEFFSLVHAIVVHVSERMVDAIAKAL